MTLTSDAFRRLLSSFATGVAVVTARTEDGRPAGMTASAVSSVSLEPPLLLVCVDLAADFHAVIATAPRFALSVLAADQEPLSRRFAAERADAKFLGVPYHMTDDGLPLLEGAAAHIVCGAWGAHPAGDHTVYFGHVLRGEVFAREPLIHFGGDYRRLR